MSSRKPLKPSQVDPGLAWFDRFATRVSDTVSQAWFFAFCVAIVVLWAPSYFVLHDINLWQLIINTLTTIITFLLVALLENTQSRDAKAIHRKLNALEDGVADLLEASGRADSSMSRDIAELRAAVGLEQKEGT